MINLFVFVCYLRNIIPSETEKSNNYCFKKCLDVMKPANPHGTNCQKNRDTGLSEVVNKRVNQFGVGDRTGCLWWGSKLCRMTDN
jgi:hypothetical protein